MQPIDTFAVSACIGEALVLELFAHRAVFDCSFLYTLLALLADAGASEPLPSSLAPRQRACLLARSSRTAGAPA
jgi:hypothetical protein